MALWLRLCWLVLLLVLGLIAALQWRTRRVRNVAMLVLLLPVACLLAAAKLMLLLRLLYTTTSTTEHCRLVHACHA